MQGRKENILTSTDKIKAFQKKLTIWKKRAAAGSVKMFPTVVERNYHDILPLILNHLDILLTILSTYFSSISNDQYDWVRNPLIESEPSEGQFALVGRAC